MSVDLRKKDQFVRFLAYHLCALPHGFDVIPWLATPSYPATPPFTPPFIASF